MLAPADLMRLAIAKAREGMTSGQMPFGCAIARGEELLAVCHNGVWTLTDPTAHAEIVALRQACQRTQSIHLEGAIVATTCEPCPMCMAALLWARVEAICFGAKFADAIAAGLTQLVPSAETLASLNSSPVRLEAGLLADDCRQLFADLATGGRDRSY